MDITPTQASLRGNLADLDVQLGLATAALRDQRDTFARQVAAHDAIRRERGCKVAAALGELEAERARMQALHQELEAERKLEEALESECRDLEQRPTGSNVEDELLNAQVALRSG